MDARQLDWRRRVEEAVLTDDGPGLRDLYAEAVILFGAHAAARWAEVLSAFDSSAVTG